MTNKSTKPDLYLCEERVFNQAAFFIITTLSGRTARCLSAALILFVVLQGNAFAGVPQSTDHENYFLAENNGPVSERVQNGSVVLPEEVAFTTMSSSVSGTLSAPVGETPVPAPGAEKRAPDWGGIGRDTGVILGAQIGAAAVTYVMPESFSGWSEEQKRSSFDKYWRNFGAPVWDKDKYYVNYVIHPYWGATYYTRARERGLDQTSSFVYSVMMSTMFEYGAECFAEKPSLQDLIVTPVVGSLLGGYVFEPLRNFIKSKQDLRWYDHALLIATDPIGLLSTGVEKLFGIKSTITVDYSVSNVRTGSAGSALSSNLRLALTF